MNPFVPDTRLTAIALGFKNEGFIADQVMPRVVVPTQEYRWTEFNSDEMFTTPNTLVGRRGTPNTVEFTATEKTASVVDYGLSGDVPQEDVLKAQNHLGYDPEGRMVMGVSELLALDREKRVCETVKAAANYHHTAALTAGSKFTDHTSDQFEILGTALEQPRVRPNTMILGHMDWFHLRRNEAILKAIGRNVDTSTGMATRQELAELLEISSIIVGATRHNTARKGQAPTIERLWDGFCAFHYVKPAGQLTDDITWGLTASWQGAVAHRKILEPGQLGLRGGVKVTVGDSVNEHVIAKEAGYLFTGTQ